MKTEKPLIEKKQKTLIESDWYDDEEHTPREWTNYEVFFKKDVAKAVEKLKLDIFKKETEVAHKVSKEEFFNGYSCACDDIRTKLINEIFGRFE